jgi:hypothetical protein
MAAESGCHLSGRFRNIQQIH